MGMIWTKEHGELFISRLREVTGEKAINQEDLAEKIGISGKTLSQWVHGHTPPKLEILLNICKDYHCSLDYLIGINDIYSTEMTLSEIGKALIDLDNILDLHIKVSDLDDNNMAWSDSKVSMFITPKDNRDDLTLAIINILNSYQSVKDISTLADFQRKQVLKDMFSEMDKTADSTLTSTVVNGIWKRAFHREK